MLILRKISLLLLSSMFMFLLISCGDDDDDDNDMDADDNDDEMVDDSDDDDDLDVLISPGDPDALSEVLILPSGSQSVEGSLPSPSASSTAPDLSSSITEITSSNGSTAPLSVSYDNVSGDLGGCFVQVDGAETYFDVPYGSGSGASGTLSVPIGIPSNVDAGEFCISFCVYDNANQLSNLVTTCVSVLRLGTGSLQISLSWDNETDQDLIVTDPTGEVIDFTNTTSLSGGALDRDDTDGFGPENIFWEDTAPDGSYTVEVNDFDGFGGRNNYILTVTGPNTSRTFSGFTEDGNTVEVTSFTKNGENLNFSN